MEKLEHHLLSIKQLHESLDLNLKKLNLDSLRSEISETQSIVKELDKQLIILSYLKENNELSEQKLSITENSNSNIIVDQKQEVKNNLENENSEKDNEIKKQEVIPEFNVTEDENLSSKKPIDIQTEKQQALADKLMKKGIDKLSAGIGISEKFLFIHELFKGDTELYIKELNKLDTCGNLKIAIEILEKLSHDLEWNIESHAYLELQKLVERKYPV